MSLVGAFLMCIGTAGCGPLHSEIARLAAASAESASLDFGALAK